MQKKISTRLCIQCEQPFHRRVKESYLKFSGRIYCGPECVKTFLQQLKERNAQRLAENKPPLSREKVQDAIFFRQQSRIGEEARPSD